MTELYEPGFSEEEVHSLTCVGFEEPAQIEKEGAERQKKGLRPKRHDMEKKNAFAPLRSRFMNALKYYCIDKRGI